MCPHRKGCPLFPHFSSSSSLQGPPLVCSLSSSVFVYRSTPTMPSAGITLAIIILIGAGGVIIGYLVSSTTYIRMCVYIYIYTSLLRVATLKVFRFFSPSDQMASWFSLEVFFTMITPIRCVERSAVCSVSAIDTILPALLDVYSDPKLESTEPVPVVSRWSLASPASSLILAGVRVPVSTVWFVASSLPLTQSVPTHDATLLQQSTGHRGAPEARRFG